MPHNGGYAFIRSDCFGSGLHFSAAPARLPLDHSWLFPSYPAQGKCTSRKRVSIPRNACAVSASPGWRP
ncbi:hypothetical protein ASZ90_001051 [hydrocarbon metagenome]|uniref:Uncharacterized protein n=1 Tax=hydrocarbon metagenome TaxID=938273 RepID=A0A0W8G7U2_9ZZZZ